MTKNSSLDFLEDGEKGLRRVKVDHRKYYRIFLILFLLSFGLNLFFLTFYFIERISGPLSPGGGKEAKESREEGETKGMVPVSIVHNKNEEYVLLCEKMSKTLHLYHSEEGTFSLIQSYPCIVGSNHVDKQEAGDLATPEGIYFLISFLSGKSLPEKYGEGAFSLNYPNFLDRMEGKKGSGIWLHGFPDHTDAPLHSEGCIVVGNAILRELMGFIKIGDTPLVIVDTIQYQSEENRLMLAQQLTDFLGNWKGAWESLDTEKYLCYYSEDFMNSEGMNYQRFRGHKVRVNRYKKFIKLEIEPKSFLLSQKDHGKIAVIRMNQSYRSDNFNHYTRKLLYLNEEQGQWKIVGDMSF
jgi:murein L,D-transpeptidase YafK